jgi:small-conductance mechanosensitive channel
MSILSRFRLAVTIALLAALVVCLALAWRTRDAMDHLSFLNGASKTAMVDLRPWKTAQALAALAVTAEEVEFAREAERLANHEVEDAFEAALREQGGSHGRKMSANAVALSQKLQQLEAAVKNDQQQVDALTKAGQGGDELDVAKAQLGLDSDERADAQLDLARAEGDQRGRINQELAAHRALVKKYEAQMAKQNQAEVAAVHHYGSAAHRLRAWLDQRTRADLLEQAQREAEADAKALMTAHNALENQPLGPAVAADDNASRLASISGKRARSQLLSLYDDRFQTQQQLAAVYAKWSAQLQVQHRIVLHLLLQSFAALAFVLIFLILLDALVLRLVQRPGLDRRRMHTLHVISKVTIQLVGVAAVLLVIFGLPNQTPAILGLTTAGLTVVLQDFIVAFFGWFVLMGRNGMRVGDWVEINGVGGEVVEIGLFRTALLETGNWTDKGHPTGRRVTFINSFAIKGQYFNFSTAGQWLWDEITVSIPAGPAEDGYALIEEIHTAVVRETEEEARLAEEEWKRTARQNNVGEFSASPAVDMRPGGSGIEIVVRYVTRAAKRFEVRNRLYQQVIGLMHKPAARLPAGG